MSDDGGFSPSNDADKANDPPVVYPQSDNDAGEIYTFDMKASTIISTRSG